MRNELITLKTKRDFSAALKKLMITQPLTTITVRQLLALTDKSRPTFYYHFADLEALIKWTVQDEVLSILEQTLTYANWDDDIYRLLQYFDANQSLGHAFYASLDLVQLNQVFREPLTQIVMKYITAVIADNQLRVRQADQDFIARLFTGGFVGILFDWLADDQQEAPEIIREKLRRTQNDIIVYALKNASY
ncbi:TetR family transcriptional regulator C-terminal domain-containing protein [Lactiplantibacillus plantarum]|uniref:TetR/AcrR family transcriptional regulator C-terminal domain-containing protein n=1 Tax=Lactiplantibacillus plantarum TaxID=1590 RepID=UPI001E565626|nr:TetR/AcrR family transcriptional regulator C-terminal domain-containing protein [Lactiplantibacillus plantarum]MCC6117913.1 TetR family transcriptional regulator C-terminal domain-containing protein [Lactiplantibacillus plantarum]MCW6115460.1 TetR family transcriptional regulator C-terminal domain-containing protein [Lactiplantibacillus plantarum]